MEEGGLSAKKSPLLNLHVLQDVPKRRVLTAIKPQQRTGTIAASMRSMVQATRDARTNHTVGELLLLLSQDCRRLQLKPSRREAVRATDPSPPMRPKVIYRTALVPQNTAWLPHNGFTHWRKISQRLHTPDPLTIT